MGEQFRQFRLNILKKQTGHHQLNTYPELDGLTHIPDLTMSNLYQIWYGKHANDCQTFKDTKFHTVSILSMYITLQNNGTFSVCTWPITKISLSAYLTLCRDMRKTRRSTFPSNCTSLRVPCAFRVFSRSMGSDENSVIILLLYDFSNSPKKPEVNSKHCFNWRRLLRDIYIL